ncbi:1-acyl-sn-glycerol-3-phosphate acyltransferase [gamma proteobacterium HTCC5015]|nr:1-acyl-sn-glycerol-3-phosphate acyltransferase [gamma proteobacterium HTCC5015]
MQKSWRWYLFQPYKWLVLMPFYLVDTLVMFTVCIIVMFFLGPSAGSRFAGTLWARFMLYASFVRVTVEGKEHIDPKQSYVVVANHQSAYDIFVVYGWLGIDFKWVMKQELRKVPCIGYACDKMGHIFIDRKNSSAAVAALQQARDRLVNGTAVFFFPEGTRRSGGNDLQPFKKGAFKMAVDLQLPMLPVTLIGVDRVMPAGGLDLMPGRVRLVFHEPVSTQGLGDQDVEILMDRVRQKIAQPLQENAAA